MKRSVAYQPEFFEDAVRIVGWYDGQRPGVGDRFLSQLEQTLQKLKANPEEFFIVEGQIRIARLRKFPYGVYFEANERHIVVIGVFHLHRDPAAWRQRIE